METMKVVAITEVRKAELVEKPIPKPKEDWALVKILSAPMCTEYKSWLNPGRLPIEGMGHEAAGEVVEVAQPCKVEVSDRVVVQPGTHACGECSLCLSGWYIHCQSSKYRGFVKNYGTYTQYIAAPSWVLSPIPDDVSIDHASLAVCGLGPTFNALKYMNLNAFDTVLITGSGPVGIGGLINAKYLGARVIVVEKAAWRREKAKELGADLVLNPADEDVLKRIMEFTDSVGVDCAVECAGDSVEAERLCIGATRRRGKVSFVGECSEDFAIRVSPDLIRKGLTLYGSWHYNLADYPDMLKVIRNSPLIDKHITHTFPLTRIQEAMETRASLKTGKVILKPWE